MSGYDIPDADPDVVRGPDVLRVGRSTAWLSDGAAKEQPLNAAQRIEHLWRVYRHTQEAIELCDKKSSVLIALAGSVLAGLVTTVGQSGQASLVIVLADPWAAVSLTALLASILLAAVSIKPRMWREATRGSVFWESILAHSQPVEFAEHLRIQTVEAIYDHLAHQVFGLARVCRRKYAWFAWAFYVSVAGGLLTAIAVVHARVVGEG